MRKKKQISEEDLINWWLERYHHTNLERVMEEHPDWKEIDEKIKAINEHRGWSKEENDAIRYQQNLNSREFYSLYPVTKEQHDEWYEWAKEEIRKVTGYKKSYIDKHWWSIYLNTSPTIINEPKEE